MRVITYQVDSRLNYDDGYVVPTTVFVPYPYDDLTIVAMVQAEAINGEYTIEEMNEPEEQPTYEEQINELEGMLNALLGVSE